MTLNPFDYSTYWYGSISSKTIAVLSRDFIGYDL